MIDQLSFGALRPAHNNLYTGNPMDGPYPPGSESIVVAMGCFWGAERCFWQLDGVWTTAVGYAGGKTADPSYTEVCTSQTGHAEAVLTVFDPSQCSYEDLLRAFWENHDPTQGMRQGNDIGTQYRSVIFWASDIARRLAEASFSKYASALDEAGFGAITTEIEHLESFYFAEDYHQQYLIKNPDGYCGLGGTGVSCEVGTTDS